MICALYDAIVRQSRDGRDQVTSGPNKLANKHNHTITVGPALVSHFSSDAYAAH